MERLAKHIQKHFTYPYRPYKVEIVGSERNIEYLITLHQFDSDYLSNVDVSYPYRITEVGVPVGGRNISDQCYIKVQKYPKRPILINLYLTDKESYINQLKKFLEQ